MIKRGRKVSGSILRIDRAYAYRGNKIVPMYGFVPRIVPNNTLIYPPSGVIIGWRYYHIIVDV